jgi:hypothetical protein
MRPRLNRWWTQPERGPLKRGHRHPAPLVDFFSKEVVRVWLALDFAEGCVDEVGEDEVGVRPEWLQYELENLGWKDILDVYSDRMLRWGLEMGVAPGQPFLLEVPHPHYSKDYNYEYGGYEYDVNFEWEVLRTRPMPPKQVAALWEREVDAAAEARAWKADRDAKQKYLVRSDVKAMRVECAVYFGSHQSTYDDMTMPSGIRYSLCSTASIDRRVSGKWTTATLVSGEDDDGDHNKAFERLVEKAMKELPGLSAEVVRALPRRSGNW